jgi:hypothetical protein
VVAPETVVCAHCGADVITPDGLVLAHADGDHNHPEHEPLALLERARRRALAWGGLFVVTWATLIVWLVLRWTR